MQYPTLSTVADELKRLRDNLNPDTNPDYRDGKYEGLSLAIMVVGAQLELQALMDAGMVS